MSSDNELYRLLELYKDIPGNEIEQFIHDMKLTQSKKTTPNHIIYWVYLKWIMKNGREPLVRNSFFKQFKRYFKQGSRDKVRRYRVQSVNFLLHPDELKQAMGEARKERTWRNRIKGQKNHERKFWLKGLEKLIEGRRRRIKKDQ